MSLFRWASYISSANMQRRKMTHLREEVVHSYEEFWSHITEAEADISKQPLIVIFKANDISKGITWCPDCNEFEKRLRELRQNHTPVGYHLRVNCGDRTFWRDPNNPFRTDPRLKINSVPTLLIWRTGKRISGHHTVNLDELRSFFMDH